MPKKNWKGLPSARLQALGETKLAECLKKTLSEVQSLPRASRPHSAKFDLCRVPAVGTRQKLTAVRHPQRPAHGGSACWARELPLPSAGKAALGKDNICRVSLFADGQHSAKVGHAVCHMFAECCASGTRQSSSLPSACGLALGKDGDTRQLCVFR